jgi:hypothetical protein
MARFEAQLPFDRARRVACMVSTYSHEDGFVNSYDLEAIISVEKKKLV